MNFKIKWLELQIWWERHHLIAGMQMQKQEIIMRAAANIERMENEITEIKKREGVLDAAFKFAEKE